MPADRTNIRPIVRLNRINDFSSPQYPFRHITRSGDSTKKRSLAPLQYKAPLLPLPSNLYTSNANHQIAASVLHDMGHGQGQSTTSYNKHEVTQHIKPSTIEENDKIEQQETTSSKIEVPHAITESRKMDDLFSQTLLWVVQFSVISIFIRHVKLPSSISYFSLLMVIGIVGMDHGPTFKIFMLTSLLLLNMLALKI